MTSLPSGDYYLNEAFWANTNRGSFSQPNKFSISSSHINYIGDIILTTAESGYRSFNLIHRIENKQSDIKKHLNEHAPNIGWPIKESLIH